ncbi:predicted protein [Plenodomus lingam JN3]|uniref:Uncharacterized protein n=1 Tax=Leptosphaeria maculans (strain JN3 / isolate v23.1.3 / race Av1-4-5-6-7-8) TaxID=985895 RepID=E5A7U7_LEPMJ|nr:predicted protein [Plenodomus lingam JN3]CBX99692.1 predicted protein [Plenodomus lingam JN3]
MRVPQEQTRSENNVMPLMVRFPRVHGFIDVSPAQLQNAHREHLDTRHGRMPLTDGGQYCKFLCNQLVMGDGSDRLRGFAKAGREDSSSIFEYADRHIAPPFIPAHSRATLTTHNVSNCPSNFGRLHEGPCTTVQSGMINTPGRHFHVHSRSDTRHPSNLRILFGPQTAKRRCQAFLATDLGANIRTWQDNMLIPHEPDWPPRGAGRSLMSVLLIMNWKEMDENGTRYSQLVYTPVKATNIQMHISATFTTLICDPQRLKHTTWSMMCTQCPRARPSAQHESRIEPIRCPQALQVASDLESNPVIRLPVPTRPTPTYRIRMSFTILATLAVAAGLAGAKPINAPRTAPGFSKREPQFGDLDFNSVINGNRGDGFNFIDGFNNFNQQQQVIQIQQNNLQIFDNGRQQAVVQQVQEVLVVDQVNNGFNNDLNNLFRKSNFQNRFQDVSTVMLVVQEIQVAIDDGRGNVFQQDIFAQSAVVANRGARETQTVMVFDERKLVAQDILGGDAFRNIGREGGIAGATAGLQLNAALPTKTAGIQLFGERPTWTEVAQDPAATLGSIWQGALEDLQRADNDAQDMALNEQIAALEMQRMDEQRGEGKQEGGEQQQQEEQKQAEEQQKQEEEQQKQEEQQQKQEEQQQKQEEQQQEQEMQQHEQQQQQEEQKQAEEQQKQAEEQQKQQDQQGNEEQMAQEGQMMAE